MAFPTDIYPLSWCLGERITGRGSVRLISDLKGIEQVMEGCWVYT